MRRFLVPSYLLLFGLLVLFLVLSPGTKAAPPVEGTIKVDPGFLLWKKGLEYQTAVSAEFSLTNAKLTIDLADREDATGSQDRSFHYNGSMIYSTWLQDAHSINGTAGRYYGRCDITKIEATPATITMPSNWWEVGTTTIGNWFGKGLPPNLRDKMKITDMAFGDKPFIKVTTLPGVEEKALGVYGLAAGFQVLQDLSERDVILEWQTPGNFQKGKLRVSPAQRPAEGGNLIKSGGNTAPIVQEVIGRESKLLYEAILGGAIRKAGDTWEVPGEALDAMIHPSLEGSFHGSVVVQASNVSGKSPHKNIPHGMNGLKLEFRESGRIGFRNQKSDLRFDVKNTEGERHATDLMMGGSKLVGEIWLDAENQCVRYASLKSNGAKYNGYLPKIGDLNNAGVKVNADLYFSFEYVLSVSPRN